MESIEKGPIKLQEGTVTQFQTHNGHSSNEFRVRSMLLEVTECHQALGELFLKSDRVYPIDSINSPQRLTLYLFAASFPQNLFHLSLNRFTPSSSGVYPPTVFSHIRDLNKFQQKSKTGIAIKAQYSQRKAG